MAKTTRTKDPRVRDASEAAAVAVLAAHDLPREDGESAIQALAWACGQLITYEQAMTELVGAALEQAALSTAAGH